MKREIRLNGLFLEYGEEQFINWCQSLTRLRFCKNHPYPDDLAPDRFIGITRFEDKISLKSLINSIKPIILDKNLEDFLNQKEKSTFSCMAKINDTVCYVSINEIIGTFTIEVFGTEKDQFTLDKTTFSRAKRIDEFLETLEIKFDSSPNNDDYCITPEFYPDIWKNR